MVVVASTHSQDLLAYQPVKQVPSFDMVNFSRNTLLKHLSSIRANRGGNRVLFRLPDV